MLKKLFESLDEKVFTTELKESLEVQFNEAVEAKATTIAEAKLQEEIESLGVKSEEHIEFLSEKAEEYVQMKQEEMTESVDKYLDRVVDEFVLEAKESLHESIKSEKSDLIIEAFDSMILATGVDVAKIMEAKDESSIGKELGESVIKYDVLVEENITLKDENNTLIQMGVISELKEGLSIVEAEKFEKLAELVEFTKSEDYGVKLQTIKESVSSSDNKGTELNETRTDVKQPVWSHLV